MDENTDINKFEIPIGSGYYILGDWKQWILAKEKEKYSRERDRFNHISYYTDMDYMLKSYFISRIRTSNVKSMEELKETINKVYQELATALRGIPSIIISLEINNMGGK